MNQSSRRDEGATEAQGGKIPLSHRRIEEARYRSLKDPYQRALDALARQLQELLEREGLHVTVRARLKTFESYYKKLLGRLQEPGKNGGDARVNDLLGVRVICPFQGDLKTAEAALRRSLAVLEVQRKGQEHSYREFGYDSTHLLVRLPEPVCREAGVEAQPVCEVQVRTTLQEAWAEIEHELVYKAELTPLDEPLRRKLASLKATLTLSDNIFQEIRDYQRQMQDELRLRKAGLWGRILQIAARRGTDDPGGLDPRAESSPAPGNSRRHPGGLEAPDDIDLMLLRALAAHNRRELEEALRLYSRILEHDLSPRARTIVLVHRGMARFERGDLEEAGEDFSKAIESEEGTERAYFLRGITRWALGESAEALLDLSESLKRGPLQVDVLVCRALLRCQQGDSAGALSDTEQVLAIAPDSAEAMDLQDLLTVELTGAS